MVIDFPGFETLPEWSRSSRRGHDLKLPHIDIFIYFHPLLVYTSVKNFLYYFSILYCISFNRPVKRSRTSISKFVKCPIAFVVSSRSRKFQVTNSRSANHFCAALSRCSGFETRQKLDRIIGTERRCFPYDCCFFSFPPPPSPSLSPPMQFRGWFFTRETILKKFPFYRQFRSILLRFIGFNVYQGGVENR